MTLALTLVCATAVVAAAAVDESAKPARIERVRYSADGNTTRVIVILSRHVPFEVLVLPGDSGRASKSRLVLDFSNARLDEGALKPVGVEDGLLQRIRTGQFSARTARVVLDLSSVTNHIVSQMDDPPRVVIDIAGRPATDPARAAETAAAGEPAAAPPRPEAAPEQKAAPRGSPAKPDGGDSDSVARAETPTDTVARATPPTVREVEEPARRAPEPAPAAVASAPRTGASIAQRSTHAESPTEQSGSERARSEKDARAPDKARPESVPTTDDVSAAIARQAEGRPPETVSRGIDAPPPPAVPPEEPPQERVAKLTDPESTGGGEGTRSRAEGRGASSPDETPRDEAKKSGRPVLRRIVLDPGHGGTDPGAKGIDGVLEKDITLAIAKQLKRRLEQGMHAEVVLTRTRDTTRSLAERTAFANARGADLFISIHANADGTGRLHGIETYTLNNSNDRATIRLAKMENGPGFRTPRGNLSFILSDLVQSGKEEESNALAERLHYRMLSRVRTRYPDVRDLGVKKGPFYVLVGAYMPCVLVETSFLSHPIEGRRLASEEYQAELVEGLYLGIADFFGDARLAKTL